MVNGIKGFPPKEWDEIYALQIEQKAREQTLKKWSNHNGPNLGF